MNEEEKLPDEIAYNDHFIYTLESDKNFLLSMEYRLFLVKRYGDYPHRQADIMRLTVKLIKELVNIKE